MWLRVNNEIRAYAVGGTYRRSVYQDVHRRSEVAQSRSYP